MIIATVGLPGSGKSTWAKAYAKEHNLPYLNTDELQQSIYQMEYVKGFYSGLFLDFVEAAIEKNVAVLIDACNLSKKVQEELQKRFSFTNIEWHFFDTPIQECIQRQDSRDRKVSQSVIENMAKDLYKPKTCIVHE